MVGTVAQGSVLCTPFKCCSFEEAECHLPPGSAPTAAILHSGRSRDDQVWEGMDSILFSRREKGGRCAQCHLPAPDLAPTGNLSSWPPQLILECKPHAKHILWPGQQLLALCKGSWEVAFLLALNNTSTIWCWGLLSQAWINRLLSPTVYEKPNADLSFLSEPKAKGEGNTADFLDLILVPATDQRWAQRKRGHCKGDSQIGAVSKLFDF